MRGRKCFGTGTKRNTKCSEKLIEQRRFLRSWRRRSRAQGCGDGRHRGGASGSPLTPGPGGDGGLVGGIMRNQRRRSASRTRRTTGARTASAAAVSPKPPSPARATPPPTPSPSASTLARPPPPGGIPWWVRRVASHMSARRKKNAPARVERERNPWINSKVSAQNQEDGAMETEAKLIKTLNNQCLASSRRNPGGFLARTWGRGRPCGRWGQRWPDTPGGGSEGPCGNAGRVSVRKHRYKFDIVCFPLDFFPFVP